VKLQNQSPCRTQFRSLILCCFWSFAFYHGTCWFEYCWDLHEPFMMSAQASGWNCRNTST